MPNASNACSGFNDASGWTFFNLNVIHDKHKDDPVTVLQADFVSTLFFEISSLVVCFFPFTPERQVK